MLGVSDGHLLVLLARQAHVGQVSFRIGTLHQFSAHSHPAMPTK